MTLNIDLFASFTAAIDRAYAEAEAAHVAGTCGESEWSCSFCESEATA